MKYDLVCYGEVLYDIYNKKNSKNNTKKERKVLSGAPLTTASIASKLGLNTAIISSINNKAAEINKIIKEIKSRRVKSLIQKNSKSTGESRIQLDKNKNPEFKIKKDVAFDYIKYNKELQNLKTKFFYFGTLAQRNKKSRETLKKILKNLKSNKTKKNNKTTTIYDVNIRKGFPWKSIFKSCLPYTDILKVNESELKKIKQFLKIKRSEELLKKVDYLFVTKGKKGAEVYCKTISEEKNKKQTIKRISLPPYKYKIKDTTGCGDSFTAGIIYGMLKNWDVEKILDFALKISAKTASQIGAYNKEIKYR